MYSEKIVAKNLEKVEKSQNLRLKRLSVEKVDVFRARIDAKFNPDGKLTAELAPEEQKFIRNEVLVCKFDFRYWAERYAVIPRDGIEGGGVGRIKFWASQELALSHLGKFEEANHEAQDAGQAVDGICVVAHKARQLGWTMLARLLKMHRSTLWQHMRGMAASVDDDKIMELYDRDKLILDNLPAYLRPSVGYDVKAAHLYFEKLNSRMLYQQSRQQSGLGQGRQFDLAHLTECAFWPNPRMIEFDFFPTLPLSINTLCMLESTANGRGNWWHSFTEEVRKGYHRRWKYIFTPWYIEERKYRAAFPVDWKPSEATAAHAKKVYETSKEFTGRDVLLPKEQLYWYETEHESARRRDSLALFLTNYCATPEESFQHTGQSQFSVETLERIRLNVREPAYYDFGRVA